MCSVPMLLHASVKSSQSFLHKVRTSRTSPRQVEIGLLCIIDISFYHGKDATNIIEEFVCAYLERQYDIPVF